MADPILLSEKAELTPWFPTSTSPVRNGVFEVHNALFNQDDQWFSLWEGDRWHGAWSSPEEALDRVRFPTPGSVLATWEWRGLASGPLADSTGASVSPPAIHLTPNSDVLVDSFNSQNAPSILTGDSHG